MTLPCDWSTPIIGVDQSEGLPIGVDQSGDSNVKNSELCILLSLTALLCCCCCCCCCFLCVCAFDVLLLFFCFFFGVYTSTHIFFWRVHTFFLACTPTQNDRFCQICQLASEVCLSIKRCHQELATAYEDLIFARLNNGTS